MFAVIYLPNFALQAALRPEPAWQERPVALIDSRETKATLLQLTAPARAVGVTEGMTPTQAMARCGNIEIRSRSLAQETAAQESLLQCAYAFSPNIEATAEGVCTMDLQGLSHGGDETFARHLLQALAVLQLQGQIGVAETPALALQAARNARPYLLVSNAAAFLAALPIESIEPTPEILGLLGKWGIRSLGEFTALGKNDIAERLENEGLQLFERASARSHRPLKLVRPPQIFSEALEWEHEIEALEPLLFILRRLIDQLAHRLLLACLVAQAVHLRLRFSDASQHEHCLQVPAPTRDADTLFRILHTYLETLRADHPIVALYLRVTPGPEAGRQFQLFEVALRDPNQFFETLARLVALIGSDRVGTPVLESTHRPDAFQLRPPAWEEASASHRPPARVPAEEFASLSLRRFRPALGATVELKGQSPVYLRSAKVSARIVQAQGPWRSSGDWWDQHPWQRDEWDVQTQEGALYRLSQQAAGWFVEGEYD